jgi:hypothetical protein
VAGYQAHLQHQQGSATFPAAARQSIATKHGVCARGRLARRLHALPHLGHTGMLWEQARGKVHSRLRVLRGSKSHKVAKDKVVPSSTLATVS